MPSNVQSNSIIILKLAASSFPFFCLNLVHHFSQMKGTGIFKQATYHLLTSILLSAIMFCNQPGHLKSMYKNPKRSIEMKVSITTLA